MVYVPILRVDLPEPRLQELLPAAVQGAVGLCTRLFDAVFDLLHPLGGEEQRALYEAAVARLPREFRRARRRVVEHGIAELDKVSEELDDAAYAFYRRSMREQVAGYSDEQTEDVALRRLMAPSPATAARVAEVRAAAVAAGVDPAAAVQALSAAEAGPGSAAARAAAAAAAAEDDEARRLVRVPGRARRAAVTTASGGAGLALGAGVLKLAQLLARLRRRQQRRRGGKQAQAQAQQQQQAGGRRGKRSGGGGSAAAGAGGGKPRVRQQR